MERTTPWTSGTPAPCLQATVFQRLVILPILLASSHKGLGLPQVLKKVLKKGLKKITALKKVLKKGDALKKVLKKVLIKLTKKNSVKKITQKSSSK